MVKITDEERFHTKYVIDEITGCWNWISSISNDGYGRFRFNNARNRAHIFSHIIFNTDDPITPDKPYVLHSCHNTICVNPSHLRAGTPKDNMDDKVNELRQSFGESHKLSLLNDEYVIWLRQQPYHHGFFSDEAKRLNVYPSTINSAYHRKTWRHLP